LILLFFYCQFFGKVCFLIFCSHSLQGRLGRHTLPCMKESPPFASPQPVVALAACASYTPQAVSSAVSSVLEASQWRPPRGLVLVKPNLLRALPLACTHPLVVAAACQWLLDYGARPFVADSPGFGTAQGVAQAIGLQQALQPLHLSVHALDDPVPLPLHGGGQWGIARAALEAEALLSLPRVKAHCQMRVTLAVKNLFGCICGLGKVLAHTRQGNSLEQFTAAIVALWQALPPVAGLADGIIAMHGTGPAKGSPFPLGCVGAAADAVALDVALYRLLGLQPAQVPLWAALCKVAVPAALLPACYPLCQPTAFSSAGFCLPEDLVEISFKPQRMAASIVRRLWRAAVG
jgi:uncharacterized protein (DUF362 family)